jgi:hypothetical protein
MGDGGHAAGGQALGYFFQCMWALVELGRRAVDSPTIELRLESLDDIQFDREGTPSELLQTKHSVDTPTNLTVYSDQLWRTLNVWMDTWPKLDGDVILRLATVAKVPEDSPLAALRADSDPRDIGGALAAISEAAAKSTSKKSEKWRAKFLELRPEEKHALISAIQIQDQNPGASDLDEALVSVFRWAIKRGQEDAFLAQLKGWWAGIAVDLLADQRSSVSGLTLSSELEDIVDRFHPENLPVHPDIFFLKFTESDADVYGDAVFVQQLMWISMENPRLWKAVRDYHRAFVQRSEWIKSQQISESELRRYAFALFDEWESIFDECCARLKRGAESPEELGQEVLSTLSREARARLRPRFDEGWFLRGTLHTMANGETDCSIGWHPDFVQRVKNLMAGASV